MNRLLAFYLLLSGLALAGPHRPAAWLLLALAHVALAALLLARARAADAHGAAGAGADDAPAAGQRALSARRWIAALAPLLVMPLLYAELPLLNQALHGGGYFDPLVIGWERALFGTEPARMLARALPSRWISEPLHAAYISYYAIIYAPPLLIGWRRGERALREAVFTLALVFFAHYLFFVYFPVEGPRYRHPSPVAEDARGPVFALAHTLLEAGSSRGAAFPSSHVGVSVAATLVCVRWLRPLAPFVALLTAGLAVGAVYGGFHYAIDAVCGALFGGALAFAAPMLRRRLEPRAAST